MTRDRTPPPARTGPRARRRSARGATPRVVTVGIDGSRASMDAAGWAALEALRHGVPLRLLHAGVSPAEPARVRRLTEAADQARGALDRAAIRLSYAHPALEIHGKESAGPAVPALLAANAEAESLILGSRGLTGFAGFLVGSVATAVTARAERPVVLVRAGERPEDAHAPDPDGAPSHTTPYRPVVLGLDPAGPGDALIAYAFDAAAVRRAPLHVVHAWAVPPLSAQVPRLVIPDELTDVADAETRARRRLSAALEPWRHKYPQVDVVEQAVFGRPGHHLLKATAGASLLVVGRRSATGPHLGRTAHSAVHHVPCPIAVVPHD
ncbi:universal stress protein [Streptomyces sp. NPDC059063]|uniref:universal stress protein n=1 Tax=unclassified Streptomyces TaxID=2593676 RepID=UPI0036B292E1